MAYELVADPKKSGYYWVVTSTTGQRHSFKSLPEARAKAQLRLLYLVSSRELKKKKKSVKHK